MAIGASFLSFGGGFGCVSWGFGGGFGSSAGAAGARAALPIRDGGGSTGRGRGLCNEGSRSLLAVAIDGGGEGGGVGRGDLEPAGDPAEIPGDLVPTGGDPDTALSTSSVGGERETPRVSLGEPSAAAMEASAAEKGMAVGGRPCTCMAVDSLLPALDAWHEVSLEA